jgi:hypothetical protein
MSEPTGTAVPLGSFGTRTVLGEESNRLPRESTGIRIGGAYTTYTTITNDGRMGQYTVDNSREPRVNGSEGFLARRFGRR